MVVTVLLFAHLAETSGAERLSIDLPAGSTVADALDRLAGTHPSIAAIRPILAVAVNERYAATDQILCDGDTLALIPPVSGG